MTPEQFGVRRQQRPVWVVWDSEARRIAEPREENEFPSQEAARERAVELNRLRKLQEDAGTDHVIDTTAAGGARPKPSRAERRERERARAGRRRGSKKPARRSQGHPAVVAANRQKHAPPDEEELELRKLTRLVRREATASSDEGLLVGPLAAAATYAAGKLCDAIPGLEDHEHEVAVANFLTERLGAVLDEFSVVEYRDWRQEGLDSAQHVSRDGLDHLVEREEADRAQRAALDRDALADDGADRDGLVGLDPPEQQVERRAQHASTQNEVARERDDGRPEQFDASQLNTAKIVVTGARVEAAEVGENDGTGHAPTLDPGEDGRA